MKGLVSAALLEAGIEGGHFLKRAPDTLMKQGLHCGCLLRLRLGRWAGGPTRKPIADRVQVSSGLGWNGAGSLISGAYLSNCSGERGVRGHGAFLSFYISRVEEIDWRIVELSSSTMARMVDIALGPRDRFYLVGGSDEPVLWEPWTRAALFSDDLQTWESVF